jgi:hypothetical protein
MCCVAVKYIKGYGWVGAKNRDRNYSVTLNITRSLHKNVQRLYIDDTLTRWTEGINEFGLAVISSAFSVKDDEKDGEKAKGKKKTAIVSPHGLAIRRALLMKDPKDAAKSLIEDQLPGATFVFNREKCFLIEAGFNITKKKSAESETPRDFSYKLTEIKDDYAVRTNHGITLPSLGYKVSDRKNRQSSEKRLTAIVDAIKEKDCESPADLLTCMSVKPHEDPFMNPIRLGDVSKNEMVTTGQLLLIPAEQSLHYRPIYSKVIFDYAKLNNEKNKVFFEIISDRKLLSFKEFRQK